MKKRLSGILAVGMLAAAVLGGCKDAQSASGKDIKILLTVSEMDTFRQTLADAAQKVAAERGVALEVADAQGIIENQVDQIQQAAKDGYDAVLCAPINVDTAAELKASAGEMPVIFCNSCPKDKYLVADKYMYVGSDEKVAGEYQAEYVLEKLSARDEINVAVIQGQIGHSATSGRTEGIKKAFAASGKKVNYVFTDHADWSADRAQELFEIFMRTGIKPDCVLCNNDSMALGIVQACKDAVQDMSDVLILGVDATADGCEAIKNGDMEFTVYQSATGQGQAAVEAAIELASGRSAKNLEGISEDGKYIWVPFEKVDSSNASQYAE